MITKVLVLFAFLLVLFAVCGIISLLKRRATTAYVDQDGRFRIFGDAVFHVSADAYVFHDDRQPPANRYQGNSNVENGLALINLRKDPSASDLTNEVQKEGWVDLTGNIYDAAGVRLGYITDLRGRRSINGSGRWFELWLRKHSYVFRCPPLASEDGDSEAAKDELVGKVVETGRLRKAKPNRYTTTARAGAFLLLYKDRQPLPPSEDAMSERLTWKDTALPAALLFTFVYFLFYMTGLSKASFPALGEQIGFVLALLLAYFALWALLRQVKIESSLDGKPFDDFLMLIDRNTGLGGMNNWIIITAAASLLVSIFIYGSDFIPLQAAILIGAWVNRKYITKEPWAVTDTDEANDRLPDWPDDDDSDTEPIVPDDADPDNPVPEDISVEKSFSWDLDSFYHQVHGELTLKFNPEKIGAQRAVNPFRLNPTASFRGNIEQLLASSKTATVHRVLRYIDTQARHERLSEMERMQFILDFVQKPNIEYAYDDECDEIGRPREYARYPDETMFDGRGDCDCKAALAAVLFREAGYKTAYVTTSTHAAVAVAFKDKTPSALVDTADQSLVTHDGHLYFFCETTGDGFRIGDLGSTTKEAVDNIIFLN